MKQISNKKHTFIYIKALAFASLCLIFPHTSFAGFVFILDDMGKIQALYYPSNNSKKKNTIDSIKSTTTSNKR